MSEHFKQHSEGRGFHTPPHPPPASRTLSYHFHLMFGKIGTKDRKRGGGGKAILSELNIADFPDTLDHTPYDIKYQESDFLF